MVVMMSLEERLDLLGKEGEELFGSFCYHELSRYCHLGLGKGEGCVAMQLDRADAEIGAAKVYR